MSTIKKMSVTQLIIITVVNMMGSGIVMLPAKLAQVGRLSIISWLVTAVGSMLLAYAFTKCGMYSQKRGGMNGYAEYTFGKAGNFLWHFYYYRQCSYRHFSGRLRRHIPWCRTYTMDDLPGYHCRLLDSHSSQLWRS